MRPVHDALAAAEGIAAAPLRHVEPDTARREFNENGQTGLDELLAALDGDVEVRQSTGPPLCPGTCCAQSRCRHLWAQGRPVVGQTPKKHSHELTQ